MGESVYTATATIRKVEGVHRRAELAVGPAVDMGVHGRVKEIFGLEDAADLPLPVDYVVAAAGT